jgi:hypothetical protein
VKSGEARRRWEVDVDAIHKTLAYAAVVLVVGGIAWTIVLALRTRQAGPLFVRFQAATVTVLVVAAAIGAVNLVTGAHLGDGLHLLYGAAAIIAIPIARSFGKGRPRASAVMLLAFVALGGILYRLFATG